MTTENSAFTRPKGKLSIYFLGGSGLSIGETFQKVIAQFTPDIIADLSIYYVDSSIANLSSIHTKENTYLIPGVEGGGKDRALIYKAFAPKVADVIERFPPGDVSLIVSSLGGGTGAVAGYVLSEELLKRGKDIMAVGVVNTDSFTEQENSAKSIASYENVIESTGRGLVFAPFHSDDSTEQEKVNEAVAIFLSLVAVFTSRRNHRQDTQDFSNWVNFERRTSMGPRLMGVVNSSGNKLSEYFESGDVVPFSTATLALPGTNISPGYTPDYHTVGYLPKEHPAFTTLPIHFTLADGAIQKVFDRELTERLDKGRRKVEERQLAKRITFGEQPKGKKPGGFIP